MAVKQNILNKPKTSDFINGINKSGLNLNTPDKNPLNPPFDTSNNKIENKFIVVVPVYNAEKYIKKCIGSIMSQTYKNFELVVVDDKSTDNTLNIINDLWKIYNHGFSICELEQHYGSPIYTFKIGIEHIMSKSEDIIITVDGDDYLFDDKVLEYLNYIYQDTNIWMSYGSFIASSGRYKDFCQTVPNFRTYRRSNLWVTSHLRTLKKKIWNKIKIEDLQDDTGNYLRHACDLAYMFPSLEMCGPKHTKFINRVLYVYNDLNPINEFKICKGKDIEMNKRLRAKSLYDELGE